MPSLLERGIHSFNKEDLLACSRGELFGPGNSQEHGLGQITAELDITPELWFFECHFPGDPVMPGCLGLDAMWQLVGFFLGWRGGPGKGRALGVKTVKFKGEVLPTCKKVTYVIDIKRITERANLAMALADGKVFADGKQIYTAEDLQVGLFPKH